MPKLSLIQNIVVWVLPILFAITLHEVAHGWVASKLGDPTAKMLGRLTINPLKHIDLFGTIIIPITMLLLSNFHFAFGWAKPVPVTYENLKNPKRDMALVAIAGPASNFIMALIWAILIKLSLTLNPTMHSSDLMLYYMGQAGIVVNLVLMVLNLIPIPPLDGSRVLASVASPGFARLLYRIEPYGFVILILLLVSGMLGHILLPIVMQLHHWIYALFVL